MQQKRLRRKARRDQRAPYQWLPNRKAGRSNSNSSMSSEGSLDLDFDDSVWKPDVKADLKSEFVMAWTIWTQMPGDAFKDVQSIGIYLEIYFEGEDLQEVTQNCVKVLCKEEIKVGLVTVWRVTWKTKKGSLQTLIPLCHSQTTSWRAATKATELSFDAWIWTDSNWTYYKTFYRMITETYVNLSIPEFSGWWWYFQTFEFVCFFVLFF